MGQDESTVRGRELGARLRVAIGRSGFATQLEVAAALDRDPSNLSRLLNGQRGPQVADVAALLALCGVIGRGRDEALALCEPGEGLVVSGPARWEVYRAHLREASTLTQVAPLVLPAPVRIESYARAIAAATEVTGADADAEVAAVLATRSLCAAPGMRVEVVVAEGVLAVPVGGAGAMADQLDALVEVAERGWVSVRVVPTGVGAHPGMVGGFSLAMYEDVRPVVAREGYRAMTLVDDRAEIAGLLGVIDRLAGVALGPGRSVELVRSWARQWRREHAAVGVMPVA